MVLNDNCNGTYAANCTTVGQYFTSQGTVYTWGKQMTQIDFKNGKVVFEAGPETREDFSSQYTLQNRLNAIKIYSYDPVNKVYTLIKSVNFFHSYFINGTDIATKRLRLDSIQIKTGTGTVAQTYQFNYNTTVALPSNSSRLKDFWGYFNNAYSVDPYNNPTTIPRMQVQYNVPNNAPYNIWIGGSNINGRYPDPVYMQAGILQKITFPTGGNTQFEYETNQYADDQSVTKYAGGLRIKSIKSYADNAAVPVVKTYKYGLNETGNGRNNFLLEDHFFMSVQNLQTKTVMDAAGQCASTPNTKTTRTYFANPTNDIESFDGSPVVYPVVTEYTGDGTTNAGKTVYTYSDKTDAKTSVVGYGKPILTSYHFVRGLLTNRSDFRRNPDNSYSIVAENRKRYQYFPFANTTGGIGLVVLKAKIFEGFSGLSFYTGCEPGTDSYSYNFNNYEIVTGDNKLVTDTTIAYDQNDITKYNSVISSNTYDDIVHLQTSTTQVTNS